MKRIKCKLSYAKLAIRAISTLHNICETFRDNVDEHWVQDVHTFNELYKQPLHNTDERTGQGEDVGAALGECFTALAEYFSGY